MQKQSSVAVSIRRSQPVDENQQVKIRADVGILFGRGVCQGGARGGSWDGGKEGAKGRGTEGAEGDGGTEDGGR
jgi:hypothetical protein